MQDKIKIAVTGAGGGVGQSIIKALQDSEYEVVALDGEALATGLYAAKTSYVIPYSNSPDYTKRLLEICQKERCRILFPGLDAELKILSEHRKEFLEIGTTVVVSDTDVIKVSDDKESTFNILTDLGFKVPTTLSMEKRTIDDVPFQYPFILKQRVGGARSQNLYLIKSRQEIEGLLADGLQLDDFIAQEYVDGDEFTCGSVTLGDICRGVIVMRRILRDGDTYKCFPIRDPIIEKEVLEIMNALKPFGACNVQLRIKNGEPYVFEINARCSGTTGARALSGFNEPKMIADYICHGISPTYEIKEQTVLRYWKELVIDNESVNEFKKNGYLHNEAHPRL